MFDCLIRLNLALWFAIVFIRPVIAADLPGDRISIPEDRRDKIITLAALRGDNLMGPREMITGRPGNGLGLARLLIDPRPDPGAQLTAENLVDVIETVYGGDNFRLAVLLRFWRLARERGNLPEKAWDDIERALLDFRYYYGEYIDTPRPDARWYDSENHIICYRSDEYLAGELFPDRIFKWSGKPGSRQRDRAKKDIILWIDERARKGFTEFDSNVYYDIDLLSLLNLYDFALDPEVKRKAGLAVDLILADMAVDSFRGIFGTPHGRTYPQFVMGARHEHTRSIQWLAFGTASPYDDISAGALALATSTYQVPAVLAAIARDTASTFEHTERHPAVVKKTYRTPDYMLSGILNEVSESFSDDLMPEGMVKHPSRPGQSDGNIHNTVPGKSSYQLHAWQATLSDDAVVFTSQPASFDTRSSPNMWTGQYANPQVFQTGSILVALHKLDTARLPEARLRFCHAWFPKWAFDEVVERDKWIFGRVGDGYIALYCAIPYDWAPGSLYADREIRAYGEGNAWVCQMGRRETDGGFDQFIRRVTGLSLKYDPDGPALSVRSLHDGLLSVSWGEGTTIDGKPVDIPTMMRFQGRFAESRSLSGEYFFRHDGESFELDFNR